VEPKSELRDSSSEEEEEEESEEHSESDEVEYSDREDSEDRAGSSRESESGSEEGDSTSGEDDQVEGSATAVDAVLQTYELLHLILAEVPLKHRTSIRRVSKTWQAAVVKIGYTLQPVAHNQWDVPLYSASKTLMANDANLLITCYQGSNRITGLTTYGFHFKPCDPLRFPKIAERESKFLTDPPVTQANLQCDTVKPTILRAHQGIKIKDVKVCFDRMGLGNRKWGKHAYIAVQRQRDCESNRNVGTASL
jgi:hypothetical protein